MNCPGVFEEDGLDTIISGAGISPNDPMPQWIEDRVMDRDFKFKDICCVDTPTEPKPTEPKPTGQPRCGLKRNGEKCYKKKCCDEERCMWNKNAKKCETAPEPMDDTRFYTRRLRTCRGNVLTEKNLNGKS